MSVLPALGAGVLSYLLLTVLLFAPGWLLLRRFVPSLAPQLRWLAGPAVSAALLATIVALSAAMNLPPRFECWLLRFVLFSSITVLIASGGWREWRVRNTRRGLLLMGAYFLLSLSASEYPNGRIADVNPSTLQSVAQLATDNLIPYNVSRYFVERISPAAFEVVPDWQFTDRGPLAGLVAAAVLRLLGVEDGSHWLGAADGVAFAVEAVLVYLNVLALFCVWTIASYLYDRRAAACALLLLSSSYFFFVNTYFIWPKLFSAYLFCAAVLLFETGAPAVLIGLLFAESMLAHDAVIFALVAYSCFLAVRTAWGNQSRSGAGLIPSGFTAFLCYLPWLLYKTLAGSGSGRMLYNHVFCLKDPAVAQQGLVSAAQSYFAAHTAADLIQTRLDNLLYPMNIFHSAGSYVAYWSKPYELLLSVSHLVFYQLLYAVGIPTVLLLFLGLARRRASLSALLPHAAAAYGGVVPAALIFACALSTVNHQWAYPAFLVTAVLAGRVASAGGFPEAVLTGMAVASNLVLLVLCFGYAKGSFVMQHAGQHYLWLLAALTSSFFVLVFREAWADED